MDREKVERILGRIIEAALVEPCTYEEVRCALNTFRIRYVEEKAGDYLGKTDFQIIASHEKHPSKKIN